MAEEKKKVKEQTSEVVEATRVDNMMTDTAITKAIEEIEQEKDARKKREAKRAICVATYVNRKTVLQLQRRRREDDITKEKLNKTKELLERLLGVETEIKDGKLCPTKKKIEKAQCLTPVEFEEETRKMNEDFDKKIRESTQLYDKQHKELRDSYEGDYRYYIRDYWDN